mgnify:CR=1 FL=1
MKELPEVIISPMPQWVLDKFPISGVVHVDPYSEPIKKNTKTFLAHMNPGANKGVED